MTTTKSRRMPQQERAQATVEAVLEATAQVLLKDGWEALSTNRIARQAGVSVGSLYQYFPNKQSIVRALLLRYAEEQYQQIVEGLAELHNGLSLEDTVRRIICAMLASRLSTPALMRAVFEQLPSAEQVVVMEQWSRRVTPAIEAALHSRAAELRPAPKDLGLVAFILVHSVDGLLHASALLDPGVLAHPSFEEECVQLVLGYLNSTSRIST